MALKELLADRSKDIITLNLQILHDGSTYALAFSKADDNVRITPFKGSGQWTVIKKMPCTFTVKELLTYASITSKDS